MSSHNPSVQDARAQDAFDQIDQLNVIAAAVLQEPQSSIWPLLCANLSSGEIAAILNERKRSGEAPITEQNVRYHRAQAQIKVREKYKEYREGKFVCGVVVQRGGEATLKLDIVAQTAICNADRSQHKKKAA